MKNIILLSSLLILILACNNSKTKESSLDESHLDETKIEKDTMNKEVNIATEFQKGAELIAKNDCIGCHKLDEKLIGPSYKEVAAKYTTKDSEALMKSIIDGGKGKWGEIPMTAHPNVSKEEATEMVNYILSLK